MYELISQTERLIYEVEPGVRIHYRRLSGDERLRIVEQCTKRGVTNWPAVDLAVARACILGWEGYTMNGAELPFSPAEIGLLPEAHRSAVCVLIVDGEVPKVGVPLRSRSGTSDATS